MLKLFIRLFIMWFGTTVPLHAQEVIDPLEKNVNAQVKAVSSLVTVNNEVYFVAELTGSIASTALMKFNPTSQQFNKVADIPEEMQLLPTKPIYLQDDAKGILPIRNQLFMPNYRQWFDPSSNTFKSAFATEPPSFKAQCKLQWNKDLLLVCSDYQDLELQQQFYRFNKTDSLFYPIEEINETSSHSFRGKELLCNSDVCGDLTFLTSYQNQPNARLHIEQKHLYWVQTNGDVIMQSRNDGDLQKLDTSALLAEQLNQDSYIAFAKDYVLYQTGLPNGPITIKRLHLPSQRIDLIDITATTGSLFGVEGKTFGPDGNFLLWKQWWGNASVHEIWRLAPQDVKIAVVQPPVQVSGSYNDVYQVEMTLIGDGAVITSETCYKWHIGTSLSRSISCVVSDSPGFVYVSNQQQTSVALKSVNSRPATPIRHLTSWNQQLFWHETDEQPRFKRLQPRTGKIDIVATDKSGRLLAGNSALWLYSDDHFYRFNPTTNRFDSSGTAGAKGPEPVTEEMGMLVDNDFYYFVNNPLFSESSSLNRFNLSSGQTQTLKLFADIDNVRILGINQGKIYLSFNIGSHWSYSDLKGGILDLTTLTIEQNDAFAGYSASGGMIYYSNQLLRVFMHQQQLFGFSRTGFFHDYGRGSSIYLSKLDLKQQKRLDLDAGSDQSGRAIIINNTILASSGEQFSADGTWIGQPLNERFHQALTFTDSTYLLGDGLQKLQSKNGVLQVQPISLGATTVVNSTATMAEVAGKLYLVATDGAQGERIRQIQLDNRAPVALDDTATTNNTTAISIEVLKNDSDPDIDNLRVLEAKATHGAVTIQANQQLSYQPKAGFVGSDEISYSIEDSRGGRANAKVLVNVSATPIVTPEKPEPPAIPESGKSGGTLSATWLFLFSALVVLRKLGLQTQRALTHHGVFNQSSVISRINRQGKPIMRQLLLSFILIFACANPLLAQQVIDPQEETIQRSVSSLSQHLFVLENQVYFIAALEQGAYAILKMDPETHQIIKVIDLPQRLLTTDSTLNLFSDLHKIGNRLLISYKEWFDPVTGTLSNAFASSNPSTFDWCKLDLDEGLILNCGNNARYRLNADDMKFHLDPINPTQTSSFDYQKDGLFCQRNEKPYRCTEWPSMITYDVPDDFTWWPPLSVQKNYIFFAMKDRVVMQHRNSNVQQTLNIAALRNERSYSIEAFSPDYILFSTYSLTGASELKRLHIPTQRIDLIDTSLFRTKADGVSVKAAFALSENGTFLLQNWAKSTFKLAPLQTKPEIIELVTARQRDRYTYPLTWVQLPSVNNTEADIITIADSCLRSNLFFHYQSCRAGAPRLNRINAQQTIEIPVSSVKSRPITPIRQLTSWNQQLFWYEHNGQWLTKRYQPQTGRTDIVDTDMLQPFKEPSDRKLLAGTSALWQLKKSEFYRFNVEANKFEANGTQGAMANTSQGILIDNDFYYFVLLPSPKNPQGFSSSFRKFSLITGQYQELKLFDDLQITRILNVSQGKFYLTFKGPASDNRNGGILYLNNLTIEANNAFALGRFFSSVFEFQQQLFGLLGGYDNIYIHELVQLDLLSGSIKLLDSSNYRVSGNPKVIVLGSTILTSWGSTFNTNGAVSSANGFKFHQALTYMQNVYLLGEQLSKINAVDGLIQAEQIKLPEGVFIDPTSSMAEVNGKLYIVAKDPENGERIRQISP
ncbi:hypothetical protein A5320_10645 [Rheinheimera sp. SA_1]|uniref:Ig-like domain-containing protein n=1 Tax=Rheinheimera sp. SA_1 TaxID=1827365 RepID=UPI0008022F12|nr:Ig-like domain-containing protein [Rheinheimera sp. SA_1]OBP15740.1 hypothetical protein A5320_10645 [Rheinheimera sp. SA_1]